MAINKTCPHGHLEKYGEGKGYEVLHAVWMRFLGEQIAD